MRIIDIDLDFFLDHVDTGPRHSDRLSDDEFKPWNENEVVEFLESQCGLKNKKIPGRFVKTHDQALFFWMKLISQKTLTIPFDLVHIDAHADLGTLDFRSINYILDYLLHVNEDKREEELSRAMEEDKTLVNEGNYLVFAIALKYITHFKYVKHKESLNDIPSGILKNERTIQIKSTEPEVALEIIPESEFQDAGNFDFLVLSHSKAYTPISSDSLLPIIKDYISKI